MSLVMSCRYNSTALILLLVEKIYYDWLLVTYVNKLLNRQLYFVIKSDGMQLFKNQQI